MVFSSPTFLFIFFPIFVGLYFILPRILRNGFILLASVGFYLLGAGGLTFVALVLVTLNWALARWIGYLRQDASRERQARAVFAAAIVLDLIPLLFFKYLVFLADVLSDLTGSLVATRVDTWGIALPLGISFYTFHFISYLADVHARRIDPESSLQKFGIYIFLFPHLVAGPVVRYSEIQEQLEIKRRILVSSDLFWGLSLFIVGLSKKILIADPLGAVVDVVHAPDGVVTTYSAWLASVCYSFQIYFDFSGYTDMAIGMARMLGFSFPQNFSRPYAARSVTEFWQRWHITLSRWFRDYVYIPLGGNRTTALKTYRNLFIVFGLCALWHGAAYTFLIWGLGHGVLIALERVGVLKTDRLRLGGLPVFVLATLLWVPFRAADVGQARKFVSVMFGLDSTAPLWVEANRGLADPKVLFLLALAVGICLIGDPLFERLRGVIRRPSVVGLGCLVLYALACFSVVEGGFNPFIYFQF